MSEGILLSAYVATVGTMTIAILWWGRDAFKESPLQGER